MDDATPVICNLSHARREGLGFPSCACWLNFACGMDRVTARERMRVAHALAKLPKVDARFASGALSYSKVRAITRIATEENEEYLLQIARHGTAQHVCRSGACRRDNRADKQRSYSDADGCLVLKRRLPPEQGALIVKALEMAMDRDFAEQKEVKDVSAETPSGCLHRKRTLDWKTCRTLGVCERPEADFAAY